MGSRVIVLVWLVISLFAFTCISFVSADETDPADGQQAAGTDTEADEASDDAESEDEDVDADEDEESDKGMTFFAILDTEKPQLALYVKERIYKGNILELDEDLSEYPVGKFNLYYMQEDKNGYLSLTREEREVHISIYYVVFEIEASPPEALYEFDQVSQRKGGPVLVSPNGLELLDWYSTNADQIMIVLRDNDVYGGVRKGQVTGTIYVQSGRKEQATKRFKMSPYTSFFKQIEFIKYPQQWSGQWAELHLVFNDDKGRSEFIVEVWLY